MSRAVTVQIDPRRRHGTIDPKIYGQFLEHIGRAIYGGVFEPGSPLSDEHGFRLDVLDACRELAPTVLRWPGGNFASGYHWRDGVGPVDERPKRHDLAWDAIESNAFGTEEFLEYCRRLGAAPYVNLNVSTGTVDEALGWVEYCNGTHPLPEVNLRRNGPHPEPHGAPIWGIGNENYGWWQHGHTSADSYGEVAREWGKLLRWTDPSIELVAVGAPDPSWNWTVLKDAARFVDYLSLHFYWHGGEDMYQSTLAGPIAAEADIVSTFGMVSAARKLHGLRHQIRLAVDEWGVWSRSNTALNVDVKPDTNSLMRQGLSARSGIDTKFEEPYDLKDSLAHASWLHVMWRHPEKVGLATEAQMVNVLGPIHVTPEGVLRHTVFWTLAIARAHAGNVSLDVLVDADAEVDAAGVQGGALPALDAGATYDPDTGRVHLSLVNRSRDEELAVGLEGVGGEALQIRIWHEDPFAGNTIDSPDNIVPVEEKVVIDGPVILPPHSHTTLVFQGTRA